MPKSARKMRSSLAAKRKLAGLTSRMQEVAAVGVVQGLGHFADHVDRTLEVSSALVRLPSSASLPATYCMAIQSSLAVGLRRGCRRRRCWGDRAVAATFGLAFR